MVDVSFNPEAASEIPDEVLQNFQSRTVEAAKNPRWVNTEHTILNIDVLFLELAPMGYVPFTTMEDADTIHGRELWAKGKAGAYGTIADFIEPTIDEKRQQMPQLEKWRVDTIIDLEPGLREAIEAAIDTWPEPKRTISKNKFKSVTNFSRLDTLFDDVGSDPNVGKTPEDIDAMWMAGASLPPALI